MTGSHMRIYSLSAVSLMALICSQSVVAHAGVTHTVTPIDISIKILHLTFMAIWVGGLAYLPSLFIAHSTAGNEDAERIKNIEQTLFFQIATPSGILTIIFGIWLTGYHKFEGGWLPLKLLLVSIMVFFHLYCGQLILRFRHNLPARGPIFFRMLNQVPLILLVAVVFLAVAKPN